MDSPNFVKIEFVILMFPTSRSKIVFLYTFLITLSWYYFFMQRTGILFKRNHPSLSHWLPPPLSQHLAAAPSWMRMRTPLSAVVRPIRCRSLASHRAPLAHSYKFHSDTGRNGRNTSYRHLDRHRRASIPYQVKYRSIPGNTGHSGQYRPKCLFRLFRYRTTQQAYALPRCACSPGTFG
jgi:hypothetical protein